MDYLHGYRIEYCPRFSAVECDIQIEENLLAQSTLWNALRFLMVGQAQLSVELRFTAHPESRTIEVALLIASADAGASFGDVAVLERLLPEEYGWRRMPTDGRDIQNPPSAGGASWRVARLVRRIEMFDLPASFPWLRGRAGGRSAEQEPAAAAPAAARQPATRQEHFDFRGKRRMPIFGFPVEEQYISQPLCLPLLGEMRDHSPDRRRLCQEMQHAAPVVLSIALHPLNAASLADDRATATYLRQWLEPFSQEMAGAGYSRLEQLRAIYDRYWLPSTHVCNLTVRVAALDDSKALGVAHSLCARLGGMRAFEVRVPSRSLPDVALIAHPGERDAQRLKEWLDALGVLHDATYEGFLTRMPHLYSLEEAEWLFRLPFARDEGMPGIPTQMLPPFYAESMRFLPRPAPPPPDRIRIGLARMPGRQASNRQELDSQQWHTLPVTDLAKHALIVGSTGSGKTVTTLFLVRELQRLCVPFLVIEPVKTEYYDGLKGHVPGLRRWRFEGDRHGRPADDFLPFDPMRLQPGVSVARHVSYLKSCFEAAFPLSDVLSLVLENGLRAYYTSPAEKGGCGLGIFSRGGRAAHRVANGAVYPSFRTFSTFFLERYLPEALAPPQSGGQASPAATELLMTWRQVFVRRFDNLVQGPLGEAIRRAEALALRDLDRFFNPFYALLQHPTVLELDGVTDNDEKSLAMAFLLTFLFERRQSEDLYRREGLLREPRPPLAHVLIVEEAHRLLPRSTGPPRGGETAGLDSRAKAVSLFVDMLAEIRAFGQGIGIVEQIPTKIVPEAVKNTNLKIMLRLTSKDDRDFLGEAMHFNDEQKDFVTNLRPGQFIAFEENVDQPMMLTSPLPEDWPALFTGVTEETSEVTGSCGEEPTPSP